MPVTLAMGLGHKNEHLGIFWKRVKICFSLLCTRLHGECPSIQRKPTGRIFIASVFGVSAPFFVLGLACHVKQPSSANYMLVWLVRSFFNGCASKYYQKRHLRALLVITFSLINSNSMHSLQQIEDLEHRNKLY